MRDGLPEPGGQAAEERRGMAGGHKLVAGGTAFGLRALRGQQVTETGCAADQLTRTGYLEALGNGLFGLLHGWSGPKQRAHACLARGKFSGSESVGKASEWGDFQRENHPGAELRKRG